jgi:hypothetical protein
MAITQPRDLPSDLERIATRWRFDHEPFGSDSRSADGQVAFFEKAGGTLWELEFTTKPINESDYGRYHAYYLSGFGAGHGFKVYDVRRPWPMAYGAAVLTMTRHGGGAFDGTCSVTAAGGTTISLSTLPSTYVVTVGDRISFPWLGGRALVKALETATAVNGVISGLTVSPWQFAAGTVPVTGTLVRAWCLMKPRRGSWNGERGNTYEPVSFAATQHLGA